MARRKKTKKTETEVIVQDSIEVKDEIKEVKKSRKKSKVDLTEPKEIKEVESKVDLTEPKVAKEVESKVDLTEPKVAKEVESKVDLTEPKVAKEVESKVELQSTETKGIFIASDGTQVSELEKRAFEYKKEIKHNNAHILPLF